MMLILLVFFIATENQGIGTGELDFVSCFFILLVKAVDPSTSPQKNKI